MSSFNMVAQCPESTVVAEYTPADVRSDAYQSEANLEKAFIDQLCSQGYEYVDICNEAALVANLRHQLELLNNYSFSEKEWKQFFTQHLANANEGIEEKTRRIQEDSVLNLTRDDGTTKNITLLDKKNIHSNRVQVINQYEETQGTHDTRYDVTVLVNGFPMVHIELKRRGVAIREAFNQIKRYQRDSFWASSGLYEYVQIFVISNGTHTKYYSNTTRDAHIREQSGSGRRKSKKTSNSFEFTSYWADGNNKIIADLVDFTKTFFAKHTLLNILARFCVFTSEKLLLVMRPYQITATERILQRIELAHNYKKAGTLSAGGYIWHTTGSGKTLTSFKTAQLVTRLPYVDKVLFVVDRKDLDYQTMKEYDRFEKGAANGNNSVRKLTEQMEDPTARIIITTIQKLGIFVTKNPKHPAFQQRLVLIFDECHRSQFGSLHSLIVKAFKNYHLFGFTGTPIFAENASASGSPLLKTTEQAFGDKLHTYTIVNAINDGNVLPFRIDYINTVKMAEGVKDCKVRAIDIEKALAAPERISAVVRYILENFDRKTCRSFFYTVKGQRLAGFNSIFAVSSIPVAMLYYKEFKRQLQELHRDMAVATIFSYQPNEADPEDESFNTAELDDTSRDFLEAVIADYNKAFNTNFDTSSDKFQNYYKDLSERMKNREIDLLIVVNMFLTGFDATTLNTLWVDKNLKQHGLIQAYSRTNRILNSVKTFGNIVCFRDLQKETDEAIALFGDKDAGGIVLLKKYEDYYNGFDEEKPNGESRHHEGYRELIDGLLTRFPLGQQIVGEEDEKSFIVLFGSILRIRNILTAFDDFKGNEILTPREFQDYQSIYLDLYEKHREPKADKEDINADIVFEMELMRQVEINIDYILMLVEKFRASHGKDKDILANIRTAINSSIELRSKKELIEGFIADINVSPSVCEDWQRYVSKQKESDLAELITSERLKPEEARKFMDNAFRDGTLKTIGTDLDKIMPPANPFDKRSRENKKGIIERIKAFFEKYIGLI